MNARREQLDAPIRGGAICALLALGLISLSCQRHESASPTTATAAEEKTNWMADFDAALTRARSEEKVLLMEFTGSDWCPPCMMLERQVFSQPEFKEYAGQHLVLLEVDFPRTKEQSAAQKAANEKLANRFGIVGFPTVILLDPQGKPLGELGYMPGGPKVFIAALEKLRSGR